MKVSQEEIEQFKIIADQFVDKLEDCGFLVFNSKLSKAFFSETMALSICERTHPTPPHISCVKCNYNSLIEPLVEFVCCLDTDALRSKELWCTNDIDPIDCLVALFAMVIKNEIQIQEIEEDYSKKDLH